MTLSVQISGEFIQKHKLCILRKKNHLWILIPRFKLFTLIWSSTVKDPYFLILSRQIVTFFFCFACTFVTWYYISFFEDFLQFLISNHGPNNICFHYRNNSYFFLYMQQKVQYIFIVLYYSPCYCTDNIVYYKSLLGSKHISDAFQLMAKAHVNNNIKNVFLQFIIDN